MAELVYDAPNPTTCVLLDLTSGTVWQGTERTHEWRAVGELSPGVVSAWTKALGGGGRDNVWI